MDQNNGKNLENIAVSSEVFNEIKKLFYLSFDLLDF